MSTLREAVREYLVMRRALGFKLQEAGHGLLDFVTFMEQQRVAYITQRLALRWAQQPPTVQPSRWAQRLSYVRAFARYRSATDPRTQIPPEGLLPFRPKRARVHIYSDDEIRSLLCAALKLPCRSDGLRPWTYHGLLGLISVAGLRLGEARHLELQDIDLKAAVLTVRSSKFGKSRFSGSTSGNLLSAPDQAVVSNGAADTGAKSLHGRAALHRDGISPRGDPRRAHP